MFGKSQTTVPYPTLQSVVVTDAARTRSPDGRLTELFGATSHRCISMDESLADLETVTLELEDETIEAVDEKAFAEHRENREAAIRDLLDEWLKTRE